MHWYSQTKECAGASCPICIQVMSAEVIWNGIEYTAKVLAVGNEVIVKRTEDLLKSMDPSNLSDEENQPPKTKRCLTRKQVARLDKRRKKLDRKKGRKAKRRLKR